MSANTEFVSLLEEVIVVCPQCSRQATLHTGWRTPRLVCPHCGLARDAPAETGPWTYLFALQPPARDPYFQRPLWMTTVCCGGKELWALNERHLDYIERFVRSTERDREFPSPAGDRGLAYKLPKWIQAARNRDELIRAIGRLRRRLEQTASDWSS